MSLTNSQYNEIMRSYEQTQYANRDQLLARYEEVYEKIPELRELDQSVSAISVAKARTLLFSEENDLNSYRDKLRELTKKRITLLHAHGYPADYLEPVYSCPDCQDTGYIDNQKCHCFKKAIINLLYSQANLPEILAKENFDTFSLNYYSENFIDKLTRQSASEIIQNALKTCHQFIDNFSVDFQNILFYGHTGVGKTFLSNCIAKELIDHSYSVMYFTAADLFEMCAQNTFYHNSDYENINQHIADCDLLIIDDLGTELVNSFTNSQLFIILNERILQRKSTIISTNLSLDDIKSLYSERTFSRISSHYTMIRLVGDDIRIQKKLMN